MNTGRPMNTVEPAPARISPYLHTHDCPSSISYAFPFSIFIFLAQHGRVLYMNEDTEVP